MKINSAFWAVFLISGLSMVTWGCFNELPHKEEAISVKHYPVVENNEAGNASLFLKVQFSHQEGTEEWEEIPINAINGFNYEMGYDYVINIRKKEAYNEATDDYYTTYTYLSEESKEMVSPNITFELPLKSPDFQPATLAFGNVELGYKMLGEIPIECSTLCDDLEISLETESEVFGIFRHDENNTIKLIQLK
ncbi:DUF4377 domain-containing protein [Echinicola strongylocentroti]|nr:DUF4377 domain-containing protein [Echinicola strongylocentroti]